MPPRKSPCPKVFPALRTKVSRFTYTTQQSSGAFTLIWTNIFFFGAAQEVHWTWWKFGRSPEPTTSYQRPSLTPRNHFISFVVGWCFGAVQKCLDCYYSCPTGTWPNRLVILIWSMYFTLFEWKFTCLSPLTKSGEIKVLHTLRMIRKLLRLISFFNWLEKKQVKCKPLNTVAEDLKPINQKKL